MNKTWQAVLSGTLILGPTQPAIAAEQLNYVQGLGIRYGGTVLLLLVVFLIVSSLLLRFNSPAQWKSWMVHFLMFSTSTCLLASLVVATYVSFCTEQPLPALAFSFFLCLPFLVAGWFTLQSLFEVKAVLREENPCDPEKPRTP